MAQIPDSMALPMPAIEVPALSLDTISLLSATDSLLLDEASKKKRNWPPWKTWEKPGIGGVRIGTDVFYLAFTFIDPDFQGSEYFGEVKINNTLFLNAAIGTSLTTRADGGTFFYRNSGEYYRFGLEYNLWHKKTRDDAFFVGLQYGSASFDHSVIFRATANYWDRVNNPNSDNPGSPPPSVPEYIVNAVNASWFEVTAGFKVRLINNFYASVTGRVKNIISVSPSAALSIVDIPGYGTYKNDSRLGINYHLMYQLPFDLLKRKKSKTKKEKKVKLKTADEG